MTKGRISVCTVVFDRQAREKIESVSVPKIIAKCGYNRTTALPIRVGPKGIGGAGFYAFLNTISTSRVHHFLKNWRTPLEDIGKALHIAMAWTQYSTSVSYPIFSNTTHDLLYVKGRTILSVRKHQEECQAKIHLNTTYVQHPLCKKDVAIIDLVNTQTTYKMNMHQKEKFN